MRLIGFFLLFWIAQLCLPDSYYDAETCGRPSRARRSTDDDERGRIKPEMKVLGGVDALPGELPWMVYFEVPAVINKKPRETPWSLCGGTMISSRHLLTAAHCFELGYKVSGCEVEDMMSIDEIVMNIAFRIGASCKPNRNKRCSSKEMGVKRRASRMAFNKQFFEDNCTKSYYDVALIELSEDVPFPHICLPHLHDIDDALYDDMLSAGFGANPRTKEVTTLQLQFVDLGKVHSPKKCMKKYDLPYDGIVCTRESRTKNVCKGDSGGGIFIKHEKRYFLQGIVSYGSPCQKPQNRTHLVADAQVNMDVNLYTATIDKYLFKQTPDYRDLWRDAK